MLTASEYNKFDCACDNCGNDCTVINDRAVEVTSACCGVGFLYEAADGEIIEVNTDLRYLSDWNE